MKVMNDSMLRINIRAAFANARYPGDDNLVSMNALGTMGCRGEADYVLEYFKGKKWQDINVTGLNNDYKAPPDAIIHFMLPSGFRYYLPAFLLLCIDSFDEADLIYSSTIWGLTRPNDQEHIDLFEERFSPLTVRQKQAVAHFLQLMSCLHDDVNAGYTDAQKALNSYWIKFIDAPTSGVRPNSKHDDCKC